VVETIHEREALMAELSDGLMALPGGLGTFEELFEIWTWSQLGMHAKPIGLLNVAGYFDRLLGFLDHAVDQQLLKSIHREQLLLSDGLETLMSQLLRASPVSSPK